MAAEAKKGVQYTTKNPVPFEMAQVPGPERLSLYAEGYGRNN